MSILNNLPCNIVVADYICSTPKKIENRTCDVIAICIVPLGATYESYIGQVSFPYINENFSQSPISVHYAVSEKGEIAQFVGTQDTALGLRDYNNPTYSLRPIPTPTDKAGLNCPFIFIGVEVPNKNTTAVELCPTAFAMPDFQKTMLAKLVCCISKLYGLTPSVASIVDGYQLDARLDTFFLPDDFISYAIDAYTHNCWDDNPLLRCATVPNVVIPPVVVDPDCPECTDDTCCPLHKAQIAVLQNTVNSLTNTVTELEITVGTYDAQLVALQAQLAEINNHYSQMLAKFDSIEDCFNCLCPQQTASQRIEYELSGSENAQQLMPLAPTRLRMPVQISDQTVAKVNSSSYFIAQLDAVCTYLVQIAVTLEYSEYFSGGKVSVDMVSCNGRQTIAETTMSGDGAASFFGQALLSPSANPCNVYFEVFTNDNKDGSRKIEYANVKIQCS